MKTIGRLILSAILFVLTGLLVAVAVSAPELVFSVYPAFSRKILSVLASVTSIVPFALWEILAALLILWFFYTLVRTFTQHRGFLRWLSGVVLGAVTALFLFVGLWGLGHLGPSVTGALGLEVREYSQQELYDAAVFYTDEASRLAALVGRDEASGVVQFEKFSVLAKQAGDGYLPLQEAYGIFDGSTVKIKRLAAAKLYSYAGTTGIFCPFTGEATVNPDTFAASLPFTMCHEIAHRMAVPAEDDSNFVAFLACRENPSLEFQYSGYYSAFIYCYNALNSADAQLAATLWERASNTLIADCRAASAHYEPYEGKVQDAAQKVNNAYLKAFQEEAGVQSYGAVADQLIALYQSELPA